MIEQTLNNLESKRTATTKKVQNVSQDLTNQMIETAGEYYGEAQEALGKVVKSASDFSQKHPYQTILGAACMGFVAGLFFRRN